MEKLKAAQGGSSSSSSSAWDPSTGMDTLDAFANETEDLFASDAPAAAAGGSGKEPEAPPAEPPAFVIPLENPDNPTAKAYELT